MDKPQTLQNCVSGNLARLLGNLAHVWIGFGVVHVSNNLKTSVRDGRYLSTAVSFSKVVATSFNLWPLVNASINNGCPTNSDFVGNLTGQFSIPVFVL